MIFYCLPLLSTRIFDACRVQIGNDRAQEPRNFDFQYEASSVLDSHAIIKLFGWWFGTFFLFFHMLGIVISTDLFFFQRGWYHQPVIILAFPMLTIITSLQSSMAVYAALDSQRSSGDDENRRVPFEDWKCKPAGHGNILYIYIYIHLIITR